MTKLTDLQPRWVGAGGPGISQPSDRPCQVCTPETASQCAACHGTGKEYEPAPARHGIGVSFLCPCPEHTAQRTGDDDHDFSLRVFVPFTNPLDGGAPPDPRTTWDREGDTFETLTLRPSILRSRDRGGCGWHGFVTSGEVTGQVE